MCKRAAGSASKPKKPPQPANAGQTMLLFTGSARKKSHPIEDLHFVTHMGGLMTYMCLNSGVQKHRKRWESSDKLFNESVSFPLHVEKLYLAQMTLSTQPNDCASSFSVF